MELIQAVRTFHVKHGYSLDLDLTKKDEHHDWATNEELVRLGCQLQGISDSLLPRAVTSQLRDDPRLYRAHLMLEELGELIEAMGDRKEAKFADGVADLLYVVVGTSETFGIPTDSVVSEICKSNSTKQKRRPEDPRIKNKGVDFLPPDVVGAIKKGRARDRV